jgi:spectinomycin phosphotransferase
MVHSAPGSIDRWLRHVHARGARVVTAAAGFDNNPRRLADGHSWVVYPFIEGVAYTATAEQIEAAGALLAHIHVAGAFNDWGLKPMPRPPLRPRDWMQDHAGRAAAALHRAGFDDQAFLRLVETRWSAAEPPGGLPMAGGSFDFKASNLVFPSASILGPVLVDTDHAVYLPRLYDLAIAALLFHADCAGAPARLWTQAEWLLFLRGYTRVVRLTAAEQAAWPETLRLAWLDHGVWLLGNWAAGWMSPDTAAFLRKLSLVELNSLLLR